MDVIKGALANWDFAVDFERKRREDKCFIFKSRELYISNIYKINKTLIYYIYINLLPFILMILFLISNNLLSFFFFFKTSLPSMF